MFWCALLVYGLCCVRVAVCAADRRVRVRTPGAVTCSTYAVRSTIGPVALVGTNEGEVVVYELLSGRCVCVCLCAGLHRVRIVFDRAFAACVDCSFFKAIRTVERGIPVLSRKRLLVTAVVCHPSMLDIEATGNDIAFAGHNDDSIVSFKVMNGEMLKEFKAPAVETLDASGRVSYVPLPRVLVGLRCGMNGAVLTPPPCSESTTSGKSMEVTALACVTQPDTGRLVLCAAFENGNLFTFDAATADPLSHFKTAPHIASVLPSSRYAGLSHPLLRFSV